MASKSIDIKIASHFNADGVLEANKGLAKLAQDVKGVNDEMRQATMRAEMAVNSYAEQADKAVKAMGGGYKTLEQQLAELATAHKSVGAEAVAAGDSATKSAVGLEMAMGLARGSTAQTAKAIALLSQKIPILGKIGVAACGAWAAAITSVLSLLGAIKDLVTTAFNLNKPSQEAQAMVSHFQDLKNAAEVFKVNMEESSKVAAKQVRAFEEQANAINKVAKAQNELARAQELLTAKSQEDKDAINRKFDSANAQADEEASQSIRDNRRSALKSEADRIRAEIKQFESTRDSLRSLFGKGLGAEDEALDQQDLADAKRVELEDNSRKLRLLEQEDEAAQALIEARQLKEEAEVKEIAQKKLEDERNAAAKIAADKAKADAEAAKKAEAERLKAVEAEQKAREKMEADLHKQRLDNAKAIIAAAQKSAASQEAVISAAQTEFDKAFAMYRGEDKGAATIAEERAYAADYKRLQKDAAKYGGKWRIDELSSLIAAGDTAGQAAKLEEWRKSSKFTPEVESMVRAAAADNAKTTAEDELRKISANTEGLAKKLDELMGMK